MADIELVIKIPEEEYDLIVNDEACGLNILTRAIANGTPLPKRHGDLIDRNDLLEYTDINICAYTPTINRYDIITTPTIIEADKGESEVSNADCD